MGLPLASLNDFSGLWGSSTRCLVSGFGMIITEACYFQECKSQVEEVVQSVNSGFVGLLVKSTLHAGCLL